MRAFMKENKIERGKPEIAPSLQRVTRPPKLRDGNHGTPHQVRRIGNAEVLKSPEKNFEFFGYSG
jgi:hypothetical protein